MKGEKMLNEGLDRESIVTKIVGVVAALGAIGGIALIVFGLGFAELLIAAACGLIAFICFVEHEKEKEILMASLGLVIVAEIIGFIAGDAHTATNFFNVLISVVAHGALLVYVLGNWVDRTKAMLAGGVLVADVIWRAVGFMAIMGQLTGLYSMLGGDGEQMLLLARLSLIGVFVGIVPALSFTVLLFIGALDYGK